jgi:TraX protein.
MIAFIGIKHFTNIPRPLFIVLFYGQFFAPPVFFFFISEGFVHTRSRKKYAIRLAIIAVITQIPYYLCEFKEEPIWNILTNWNVLASLFAGLMVLIVWETKWRPGVRILIMLAITAVTVLLQFEWMGFAQVAIFSMYMLRKKPAERFLAFFGIMLLHQYVSSGFYLGFNIQSVRYLVAEMAAMIVITFFYNGRKGRFPTFSKWIFYVFYPLHLLVAYIIKLMIGA